jgi:Leishmanolysin
LELVVFNILFHSTPVLVRLLVIVLYYESTVQATFSWAFEDRRHAVLGHNSHKFMGLLQELSQQLCIYVVFRRESKTKTSLTTVDFRPRIVTLRNTIVTETERNAEYANWKSIGCVDLVFPFQSADECCSHNKSIPHSVTSVSPFVRCTMGRLTLVVLGVAIWTGSGLRDNQNPLRTFDVSELAELLNYPELLRAKHVRPIHSISIEEPNGQDTVRGRPMRRKDLDPTASIAPHRHVNYNGGTRKLNDLGDLDSSLRKAQVWNASEVLGAKTAAPSDSDTLFASPLNNGVTDPSDTDAPVYQPIRIHFDASELYEWRTTTPQNSARVEYLVTKVLPGLAAIWSSALNVIPVQGALMIDYAWCPFGQPTNQAFTRGFSSTDIVVFVTANSDKCTSNVLASAASCYWDQYERPTAGSIDFCLDNIDSKHLVSVGQTGENPNSEFQLRDVDVPINPEHDRMLQMAIKTAVHEFSQILGVSPHDFVYFYDSATGAPRSPQPKLLVVDCVSGQREQLYLPYKSTVRERNDRHGKRYYEVTLPTVRQVVRNQFNCQSLTGAPLENQDAAGHCFGSHFEERLFFHQGIGNVQEILSPLTLALLQDSGWYLPNYRVAKLNPFGYGAGCDFVEKDCVQNGKVPTFGEAFFCNAKATIKDHSIDGEYGCDPTYSQIGLCDLVDYAEVGGTQPPSNFQYFPGKSTLGSLMTKADYCPTYTMKSTSCRDVESLSGLPSLTDSVRGMQTDGAHSRCFPTVGAARPICLDVTCDSTNQAVQVVTANGTLLQCNHVGEIVELPGTDVQIKCPPTAAICPEFSCPANCAGRGICDFSSARCKCNNGDDRSSGCFDIIGAVPPQYIRGWEMSGVPGTRSKKMLSLATVVVSIALSSKK